MAGQKQAMSTQAKPLFTAKTAHKKGGLLLFLICLIIA
jgi:hypothetical protein